MYRSADAADTTGIALENVHVDPVWRRDQKVQASGLHHHEDEGIDIPAGDDIESKAVRVNGDVGVDTKTPPTPPRVAQDETDVRVERSSLQLPKKPMDAETAGVRPQHVDAGHGDKTVSFDPSRLTICTADSPDSKNTPMRPSILLRGEDSFFDHEPSEEDHRLQNPSPPKHLSSLPFQESIRNKQFKIKTDDVKEEDEGAAAYRFLDRAAPFHQSHGHLNFFRGVSRETEMAIRRLYFTDWYHTFLNLRLRFQLLLFSCLYVSLWIVFAIFFYLVPNDHCALGISSFLDAYYLSIETLETIGYGVPNQYFENCWEVAVILSVQAMVTTIFNALVIGVIFSRMSRPQSRASTVVFSSTALVQYNGDGAPHLVFRVADLRRHQLIEGHIRCYCVVHDNYTQETIKASGPSFQRSGMQVYPMRLNQPDDSLGGMLLLTTPQFVIHRIDPWSPLSPYYKPMELRPFKRSKPRNNPNVPLQTNVAGGIPQRMSDNDTGNRVAFMCEVCGQEFATYQSLQKHIKFEENQHVGYDPKILHEPSEEELKSHWRGKRFEVFCICEGIEPFTSSTIQARHSYLTRSDIVFGHSFFPCVQVQDDGLCLFDVTRFHKTMKAGPKDTPPPHRVISASQSEGKDPHSVHSVKTPDARRFASAIDRLFSSNPQVIMVEDSPEEDQEIWGMAASSSRD